MRIRRSRRSLSAATPSHRGGSGDPLVLIHGFTDTWSTWRPVLDRLEAHHDVFAPTLAGHHGGETVAPGTKITASMFADVLERQLDELGFERVHIAGNSLGGWLALELAARGRARSAVAICPAGGWYPRSWQDLTIGLIFQRNALAMRAGDWWIRPMAARPRLRQLAVRDLVAASTRLTADQARRMFEGAAGCEILHETLAHARRTSLFGDLGPIDCRVRILYGTKDRIIRWPGHYKRLRRLLPDAEYLPLEGLGHLAMWDDPATVAKRILEVTRADRAEITGAGGAEVMRADRAAPPGQSDQPGSAPTAPRPLQPSTPVS